MRIFNKHDYAFMETVLKLWICGEWLSHSQINKREDKGASFMTITFSSESFRQCITTRH